MYTRQLAINPSIQSPSLKKAPAHLQDNLLVSVSRIDSIWQPIFNGMVIFHIFWQFLGINNPKWCCIFIFALTILRNALFF